MRVKLSYTVESDAVLTESAKLINLTASDFQHAIGLFASVQGELTGVPEEGAPKQPVNIQQALEMIDELRQALLQVDIRLSEVTEIVHAYRDYQQNATVLDNEHLLPATPLAHTGLDSAVGSD